MMTRIERHAAFIDDGSYQRIEEKRVRVGPGTVAEAEDSLSEGTGSGLRLSG